MISTTVSDRDKNGTAYAERMGQVQAWLIHHSELPKILKRRIKRYFQKHLTHRSAVDDTSIILDLSPALVQDVSAYLIPEELRTSTLSHQLPNSALVQLLPILEKRECDTGDYICTYGEAGTHMYLILDGKAYFVKGHQWKPHDSWEDE